MSSSTTCSLVYRAPQGCSKAAFGFDKLDQFLANMVQDNNATVLIQSSGIGDDVVETLLAKQFSIPKTNDLPLIHPTIYNTHYVVASYWLGNGRWTKKIGAGDVTTLKSLESQITQHYKPTQGGFCFAEVIKPGMPFPAIGRTLRVCQHVI